MSGNKWIELEQMSEKIAHRTRRRGNEVTITTQELLRMAGALRSYVKTAEQTMYY